MNVPTELISVSTLALVTAGLTQMLKGLLPEKRKPWLPVIVTTFDVGLGVLMGLVMAPAPEQLGLSLMSWARPACCQVSGPSVSTRWATLFCQAASTKEPGFAKRQYKPRPKRQPRA